MVFLSIKVEDSTLFNRGKLMNIGFRVAMSEEEVDEDNVPWECAVFHDVDHLPEDARNVYRCSGQVSHQQGHVQ